MRRRSLIALASAFVISLVIGVSGAQAVMVTDAGNNYGVALVPGTRASLATAGISPVTSVAPCVDPALTLDLILPGSGLCFHSGGQVLHGNETFALTWDPLRRYWQTTRNYVEQFLRDVADGSGTLTSQYAITGQYTDATGRAANASVYGGGCIDYGQPGGATCAFSNGTGSSAGNLYAPDGCDATSVLGTSYDNPPRSNTDCLTDSRIQAFLTTTITGMALANHVKAGYSPVIALLLPPGVEVCLDSTGMLCSANTTLHSSDAGSTVQSQFCSYHSDISVNGHSYAYVVQPWTAHTQCDEPDVPAPAAVPTALQLATDVGARLVSPLSQAHVAAIVNPQLNAWYANDGSEINDNMGCVPLANSLDSVTVGSSSQNPYLLQREFSNAGVLESDPNAPFCAPGVALAPTFVVPSAVNRGDVVQFDGSTTVSSLIVPKANYAWNFGDGTTGVGPSVIHTYAWGGSYPVTLAVTDRGNNHATLTQSITVLGPSGPAVKPPAPPKSSTHLKVHLQILPQSLKAMLRGGMTIRLSSNENASGIATLSIPRSAAKQAHIASGRAASVVIGRGTVSRIKTGTGKLHLGLSRATAAKLKRLGHVTMTVRLTLVGSDGSHVAIVAAGRY
jgi:hypothetical protein